MAICYNCKEQFYGEHCDMCGWEATYKCWNCKSEVSHKTSDKCSFCGWYSCISCGECGCSPFRPQSNEEKRS